MMWDHLQYSRLTRRSASGRRGGAMVLVLVVLFLCVSMVLVVQSVQGRRHMELQMRDVEIRLRHGLLEVLQEAQQVLASDTNLFADTESEAWAQPQDGQWENGVHFHFRLHDAQARFDLNNLSLPEETVRGLQPADLLAELLVHCGYFREEDTIAALVDWLDADEEGVREAGWYHDQGDVRSPVNRPFYSLAELGAFSSRTREWMDSKPRTQNRIREFEGNFPELVTVLPRERRKPVPMNINSVAPELLLALFGAQNRAWADTVLQVRANGPIEDLELFLKVMEEEQRQVLRVWLTVQSNFFVLSARVYWEGVSKELQAILYRDREGHVEVVQCQW